MMSTISVDMQDELSQMVHEATGVSLFRSMKAVERIVGLISDQNGEEITVQQIERAVGTDFNLAVIASATQSFQDKGYLRFKNDHYVVNLS